MDVSDILQLLVGLFLRYSSEKSTTSVILQLLVGLFPCYSYANNNIHKLFYYEQNGYYAGENMILTFETSKVPLDSKTIKNKIRQYLLS